MVPNDEDLHVEHTFWHEKRFAKAVNWIALKYNFKFKVKNLSLRTQLYALTIVVVVFCERRRWTRMSSYSSQVYKEHVYEVDICRDDHKHTQTWFIGW